MTRYATRLTLSRLERRDAPAAAVTPPFDVAVPTGVLTNVREFIGPVNDTDPGEKAVGRRRGRD